MAHGQEGAGGWDPRCLYPWMGPVDTPTGTDDQTENRRPVEDSGGPQRPAVPRSESVRLAIVE